MNYLLFVYYDNTVENSETSTNEIASQIAEQMTSKEAKFIFGDKHAIFHFASDMSIDEMAGWIDIINEDLDCFQYFLIPKPRINYEFKASKDGENFMDIADIIMNLKKPKVCTMTLDELLDKIILGGMESLTQIEKEKLEEYSKSI